MPWACWLDDLRAVTRRPSGSSCLPQSWPLTARRRGKGLIGGFDALVAAGADAQDKFLGQSAELRAAFTILSEEMPTIRARTAELAAELAGVAAGEESLLDRQRRIAEADPGEQARLARVRAAINRERENERQFVASGSARQAAIDKEMAALKSTNQSGVVQFGAKTGGLVGETFGAEESFSAAMTQAGGAFVAGLIGQSQAYQFGQVAEARKRAATTGQAEPERAPPAAPTVTRPPAAPSPAVPPPAAAAAAQTTLGAATRDTTAAIAGQRIEINAAGSDWERLTSARPEVPDPFGELAATMADFRLPELTLAGTDEVIGEQKDLQRELDETTRRLREQIETRGMDAAAIERWRLQQLGANDEQIATVRQLQDQAAAAEGPKQSVAGTFSGWRLTGQFGGLEQTAKEQLAETKIGHRMFDRMITVLDRIEQKKLAYTH